jgi:NAD(P)-dependent dehydrogenase (short-subunit alcohol dehydrogenase family)
MDLHLNGKTALITGASKGIGLGIARSMAAEGCNLHLAARSDKLLEQIQADIRKTYKVDVQIHAVDLSKSETVSKLLENCRDVDILFNNAGGIPNGALDQVDEATWRAAWDLKVFGYINMTRAFLAVMKQRRAGVIINIIGMAAERVKADYVAGSTGNAALMAFTRAVGSTSLDFGVRVLGINPGLIITDRLQTRYEMLAKKEFGDAARWQEIMARAPQVGKPEDISQIAAFLASDQAAFISGVAFNVDGGAAARATL